MIPMFSQQIISSHIPNLFFLIKVNSLDFFISLLMVVNLWIVFIKRRMEVETVNDFMNCRGHIVSKVFGEKAHVVQIELCNSHDWSICVVVLELNNGIFGPVIKF